MNLEEMLARQQELVDVAKKAGRDLNEEEKREFDKLTTAIRNYEKSEEPTSREVCEVSTLKREWNFRKH